MPERTHLALTKHPVYGWDMTTCVRCGKSSVYAAIFERQLCLACANGWDDEERN